MSDMSSLIELFDSTASGEKSRPEPLEVFVNSNEMYSLIAYQVVLGDNDFDSYNIITDKGDVLCQPLSEYCD